MLKLVQRKKKYAILLIVITLFLFAFVYAYNYNPEQSTKHIFDPDGTLDATEKKNIENRILQIERTYGAEHVIVINMSEDLSYARGNKEGLAEDFYRSKGYGYGESMTGSILFVDFFPPPGDRDIVIKTFGNIISKYQPKVKSTISTLGDYFSEYEVKKAVNFYLDTMVKTHETVGKLDENGELIAPSFISKLLVQSTNKIILGVSAFLALVFTLVPLITYRGKNTVTSLTYEEGGGFDLTHQSDIFTHSHTTRSAKPKSSSSSGGSGGSSGGGSGKF